MRTKALIFFTIICLYFVSAVSCSNAAITASAPLPPNEEFSPDITSPEIASIPSIKETLEKTAVPVINHCHNTEPDLISIGGTCERDSQITITSPSEKVTVTAHGNYFLASVRIPVSDTPSIITVP